MDTRNQKW